MPVPASLPKGVKVSLWTEEQIATEAETGSPLPFFFLLSVLQRAPNRSIADDAVVVAVEMLITPPTIPEAEPVC